MTTRLLSCRTPSGESGTALNLRRALDRVIDNHRRWKEGFGDHPGHDALAVDDGRLEAALDELGLRLRDNYPFFHPRYAGQMLKPPHPAAVAGYVAAMLVNPNNHALDGGPATARMEREVIAQIAGMFGFGEHLGHLTTSGTIANLEALYVAREIHPGRAVAFSADSHYTHARMCRVLGIEGLSVPVDGAGRMDVDAVRDLVAGGRVGTVVVTAGTTGLGAVDPVHEVLAVCRDHGVRVHVDAAYGGFFALLAGTAGADGVAAAPWEAIAHCDSVVVDPHKHGLQPYGCGAVVFRDPAVGRFYVHDSPYTYFTSEELHLGEISLECSRAGAAAAALWLTLRLFPLTADGLGAVLAAGRRAAGRWAALLADSPYLRLYQEPELDIVTYFPVAGDLSLSAVDSASQRVMGEGMGDRQDPVFLSVLRADARSFTLRHPDVRADRGEARVLRSVLMKPESEPYLDTLHRRVERLAAG
ncbi:histidine decarboxylase [Streptosporangium roseum]|uniref:Pyridoxal-dependent decarboxylase conserved domain protein n=1 Tax=Streptosporangium roseum (strain ATCC 12428 / DSM 43021 / JCM 3005 / KCTC 9067 / NCIMB 10171 / NRRL 2505 / NI 9100) TaxID=479432 RepID=D2B394_STRRD|nr:pyridoxal-dependent decarboxylase conserved domain protein [Streptosporangium roseum DSM 43021]